MDVSIRHETPADHAASRQVIAAAFGRAGEAQLVDALREQGFARVALVAAVDGDVVGHLMFSELSIQTPSGPLSGLALAPLAVAPAWQNQGIGTRLTERGLEECRAQGHRIVIVLGHPHYYPRFGFSTQLAQTLESPYAGDSFMALELVRGALDGVRGEVVYSPPFGGF